MCPFCDVGVIEQIIATHSNYDYYDSNDQSTSCNTANQHFIHDCK